MSNDGSTHARRAWYCTQKWSRPKAALVGSLTALSPRRSVPGRFLASPAAGYACRFHFCLSWPRIMISSTSSLDGPDLAVRRHRSIPYPRPMFTRPGAPDTVVFRLLAISALSASARPRNFCSFDKATRTRSASDVVDTQGAIKTFRPRVADQRD